MQITSAGTMSSMPLATSHELSWVDCTPRSIRFRQSHGDVDAFHGKMEGRYREQTHRTSDEMFRTFHIAHKHQRPHQKLPSPTSATCKSSWFFHDERNQPKGSHRDGHSYKQLRNEQEPPWATCREHDNFRGRIEPDQAETNQHLTQTGCWIAVPIDDTVDTTSI